MVKHIKLHRLFLVIILIGIVVLYMLNSIPVDALELSKPDQTIQPKRNFDMTPFYWMIGVVGGCIAITLSYVSWKKYQQENKNKMKDDSNG